MKKVVAIVAVLLVIVGIIYFNAYTNVRTFDMDGYIFTSDNITKNLVNGESTTKVKIDYAKVKYNDSLYSSRGKYYIGKDRKISANTDYPIVSSNSSTILILSNKGKLVDSSYRKTKSYANTFITDNKLFNENDYERADNITYLFVELDNSIFVNLGEIKIESTIDYDIPLNSFVSFSEDSIRYYYLAGGKYNYHEIKGIDKSNKIILNEKKYSYEKFLERLGLYIPEEKVPELDIAPVVEDDSNINTQPVDDGGPKVYDPHSNNEKVEKQYVKPTVTFDNPVGNVYSVGGKLDINDPTMQIVKSPTFEFWSGTTLVMRKSFATSGYVEVKGLYPETDYEVIATFNYKNENNQEVKNEFARFNVSTKGISGLEVVDFGIGNIDFTNNSAEFKNMGLNNNATDEVLKGIKKMVLNVGNKSFQLSQNDVAKMLKLQKVDYATAKSLVSNTLYDVSIDVFDNVGNKLKTTGKSYQFKTAKQAPSGSLVVRSAEIGKVVLGFDIENKDNINIVNQKYEIYDSSKNLIKSGNATSQSVTIDNLDSNELYLAYLYGDYDLEDGMGILKNQLILDGKFTTKSISTLGYVKIDINDVVTSTGDISYNITMNDETNYILKNLLTSIKVSLIDSVDNSVVDSHTLSSSEFSKILNSESVEIRHFNLSSNHSYYFELASYAEVGTKTHEIKTNTNLNEVKTMRFPAIVHIVNKLVSKNLINFDTNVSDVDGAIQSGRILLEVRNSNGALVYYKELEVNGDYENVAIEKLDEGEVYTFSYKVEEYNEGHTNKTFKTDYAIYEERMITEDGLSGSIAVETVLNQIDGINLFNPANNRRWKTGGANDIGRRKVNLQENTVSLGAKNGYRTYSYYLPEYKGQVVTVSFKVKYANANNAPLYICNSGSNNCANYNVSGVKQDEYISYSKSMTVYAPSPYISFTIRETNGENNVTTVVFKDLQIEAGSTAHAFRPYKEKPNYLGTFLVNLKDKNHEISRDDFHYYLRYYQDDELVDVREYDFNDNYEVVNQLYNHDIVPLSHYDVKLSVRMKLVGRDNEYRYYDLASVSFDANDEIRTIRTYDDFVSVHTSGIYLVAEDIDYRDKTGGVGETFNGIMDFQGHKVYRDTSYLNKNGTYGNSSSRMFQSIGPNGVVKNMDLHVYFDGPTRTDWYGIVTYNSGTVENIMVTLEQTNNKGNAVVVLVNHTNYGIIRNFVINCKESLSTSRDSALISITNYGTIMNGYVYGAPIDATYENAGTGQKRVGVITRYCGDSAYLANIFALIDVNISPEATSVVGQNEVGNISGPYNRITLRNVYSYSSGTNRDISKDVNIEKESTGNVAPNVKNLYYATQQDYANKYSNKVATNTLRQIGFQNIINETGAFEVEEYVKYGYYPHLIWPDVMPNQEYIKLPYVDNGNVEFLNMEDRVDNYDETVDATLVFQNTGRDQITGLTFSNGLKARIVSQEHGSNKTKVKVVFYIDSDDTSASFITKYSLTGIGHRSSSGIVEPDIVYGAGQRYVSVDMYKNIYNVADFKNNLGGKNSKQNFRLQADLDFNGQNWNLSTFNGKLDGNNHTIKNIREVDKEFINSLNGTVENLFVYNYTNTGNGGYGGFFGQANQGSIINNVHLNRISISDRSSYVGGFVGYVNGATISNCSISDVTIKVTNKNNARYGARYGGFVGESNNALIQNSYVRDLNMEVMYAYLTYGLGGFVGRNNSGHIQDCYSDGNLQTNQQEVGGFAGYNSAYLDRIISNVNVYTQQDSVGGIAGYSTNDNIRNTLALGDVYSSKIAMNINRTIGNRPSVNSNYASDAQRIDGFMSSETNGDFLVTLDELKEATTYEVLINLGNQFNYETLENSKGHNLIPKIKDLYTREVLPEQKAVEFYIEEFNVKNVAETHSLADATIQIYINNPENFVVKDLNIDGLRIASVSKNITENGETLYEVYAIPERFYDSYFIDSITYVDKQGNDVIINPAAKVNLMFYKNLATFEDWQQIETDVYENYRLINDINFIGKTNVKTRVSMNRLEGTDGGHALKNISVNQTATTGDFGLIDTLTGNIANVNFENVTITSNTSNSYMGIIRFLTGTMYDVNFNNVTLTDTRCSYVGSIAYNQSPDIKRITLENMTVTGVNYTGSFIAYMRAFDISYVTASHLNVTGSSYVGGVIGYRDHTGSSTVFHVDVNDAHVTATYDEAGGVFGRGAADYVTAQDIHVSGRNQIGAISGRHYVTSTYYADLRDAEVTGSGEYIGGAYGSTYYPYYTYVDNVTVKATRVDGDNYVGGISGGGGYTVAYCGIRNSTIENKGRYTGGIRGRLDNAGANYNYVYNTRVEGVDFVGGIAGFRVGTSTSTIAYNISNAEVVATGNYAGGILGRSNNRDANPTGSRVKVYRNIVAGSSITSYGSYAGSILAHSDAMPYTGDFYENFVAADVYSSDGDISKFFVGNDNEESTYTSVLCYGTIIESENEYEETVFSYNYDYSRGIRAYEGSTYNGVEIATHMYPESVRKYTVDELRSISTFKDNFLRDTFNYNSVPDGKYPYLTYQWHDGDIQIFDLPVETQGTRAISSSYNFPDVKVYVSDVDKINVEFSSIDEGTTFTINNRTMAISQLTYTYYYDFIDDFTIELNNRNNKKTITILADDLREYSSVSGNDYYFINGEKVESSDSESVQNMSLVKDKYNLVKLADSKKEVPVNMYNDKVLLSDKNIYDLKTKTVVENDFENLTLVGSKPLYSYKYGNNKIDTYYNYSVVNGKVITKQLFVKDGGIEMIDSTLNSVKNSVLVDQYNGKSYLIYLGTDGKLHSLKDDIKFPKKFSNSNIKSISTDMYGDSDIVFVLYNNSDYVVFNYRTGNVIKKSLSNDTSVMNYLKNYTNNSPVANKNIKDYQDSLELIDKMEKKSISEVLNKDDYNSSKTIVQNKYTSIYNPATKKYDVYQLPDSGNDDTNQTLDIVLDGPSVSNVINNNVVLYKYYIDKDLRKNTILISVIVVVCGILVGIVVAVVLLRKNIVKDDDLI